MTDVRHLHFGEPVPVNALADFSSEQARQEQAVFLGKDEQGKPVLVPRDTWRKTNIQGSRDFPSKNDKVLWRPRRLWPPEGYYFFEIPIWALFE